MTKGSLARDLNGLIEDVASASATVMTSREESREAATRTIRQLERQIQEAIAGDTLRGLPRLTVRDQVFYGLVVTRLSALRSGEGDALAWSKDGRLVVVEYDGAQMVERPARDDEFLAQDFERVVLAARTMLELHVSSAEKTSRTYARVLELADRLSRTLGA